MKPLLEAEGIDKWFGNVHAVNNVDVKVNPQEIIGLIGDNGAGKSTLVKILVGLLEPTKGKIKFKGKEVKLNSVKDSRALGIEIVYQEQALVECFSVAKNIFLGREPVKRVGPVNIIDKDKMVRESERLVKKLGLRIADMDQEAQYCSGGEKQGVALARALSFKSDLVILDEPTTAMSVEAVKQILSMLKELKKEGASVIIITHRIDQLYPIADRFIFMRGGKKVAEVGKESTSRAEVEGFLTKTVKSFRGITSQ